MERTRNETSASENDRAWLLIDCAHQGEVRIARALPSAKPTIGNVYRFDSSIPTFTDVLMRFEKESGYRLSDLKPIVAIAGIPGLEAMNVERSRWVISRSGIGSLFGTPAVILNEVAAQAWALRTSMQGVTPICGTSLPDLTRRGRYLFLTYEEGVGTAIIDIDDQGHCTVLDAEGGQIDFAPIGEREFALCQSCMSRNMQAASWEQILMTRRTAADAGSRDNNLLFAKLLGRFVSNLIYTTGAWNGAFITGHLIPRVEEMSANFVSGLSYQRPYHRQLAAATCWRVSQTEAVLKGSAALLAYRHSAYGA